MASTWSGCWRRFWRCRWDWSWELIHHQHVLYFNGKDYSARGTYRQVFFGYSRRLLKEKLWWSPSQEKRIRVTWERKLIVPKDWGIWWDFWTTGSLQMDPLLEKKSRRFVQFEESDRNEFINLHVFYWRPWVNRWLDLRRVLPQQVPLFNLDNLYKFLSWLQWLWCYSICKVAIWQWSCSRALQRAFRPCSLKLGGNLSCLQCFATACSSWPSSLARDAVDKKLKKVMK